MWLIHTNATDHTLNHTKKVCVCLCWSNSKRKSVAMLRNHVLFLAMKLHILTHTSHHAVVIETVAAALVIGWLDETLLKEEATSNMPLNMPLGSPFFGVTSVARLIQSLNNMP